MLQCEPGQVQNYSCLTYLFSSPSLPPSFFPSFSLLSTPRFSGIPGECQPLCYTVSLQFLSLPSEKAGFQRPQTGLLPSPWFTLPTLSLSRSAFHMTPQRRKVSRYLPPTGLPLGDPAGLAPMGKLHKSTVPTSALEDSIHLIKPLPN